MEMLKREMEKAAEQKRAEEQLRKGQQRLAELKKQIESIHQRYESEKPKVEAPELPEYEVVFKQYDAPSDEELTARAQSKLSDGYLSGKRDLERAAAREAENLESERRRTEEDYAETAAETDAYYEQARQNSSDSALRRGLARSSIAQLGQDELNKAAAAAQSQLSADLRNRLGALEKRIAQTAADREQALAEYDLKHAANLTRELEMLKDERDKRQDEVLEYNNALAQKLEALAQKRADWEKKYAAESEKEYERQERETAAKRAAEVDAAVTEYLASLGADGAKKALREDPYLRSVLSDSAYARFYNAYFR